MSGDGMSGDGMADQPHGLTHVDAEGTARMVDVGAKDTTLREAVAEATLHLSPATAALLAEGGLPKGDARTIARIAGIQAAKRTSELIPLCHQIALTSVEVDLQIDAEAGRVTITATARTADRTGVEMEALVAASVAGLTLYDMIKATDRDAVLTDVQVVAKSGGRRGAWQRER